MQFTPTDLVNYNIVSRSVRITVNNNPVITWSNPAAITWPTPLSATQLDATTTVPGSFVYTPPLGTILTPGVQALSAQFTPTDQVDYNIVTKTVTIVVRRAKPVITWPNPAAITYGTALSATQLNASASVPGTFVYTPPAGTVPGGGTQKLSVQFTPADLTDYSIAHEAVYLSVNLAKPVITWTTPASITVGTPLSATQLNATASVPGTFVYMPPSGTVLNTGNNQRLQVKFTPTDSADYKATSAAVTINVTK